MLKKIFRRNRSNKKKSKNKANKLNISTGNIQENLNMSNFIESAPGLEDEDDEIDLPKLNFTCILNNPLEDTNNTSIFGQLISRFQEEQRRVTEEERIKKDGYKFDIIDIIQDNNANNNHNNSFRIENKIKKNIEGEEEEEELDDILNDLEQLENIFNPKKNLEQCIQETNEKLLKGKTTFKLKKYVDLSYNNYIAKIKHEYIINKDNHKKNIFNKITFEDLINQNIKLGNQEELIKRINNYRQKMNDSMKLIQEEFKVDSQNYKIKDNLLNSDINQILIMI